MRVASVQLEHQDRPKAETLEHVLTLLDQARGNDLILLPELWPCGAFGSDRFATDAEPLDGPLVRTLRERARALKCHLFTGSIVERDGADLFNTSLLLGPDGALLGRYRKMHLFGYQSDERRLLRRGEEVAVLPTPWGRAGLATCYDLRFPELFRRMIDRGAEFFLVPAGWPYPRLESWTLFNRARANENLAFLFSCNSAGRQGTIHYAGHSVFVDPRGQILAEAGDAETILTADVDIAQAAALRREFPALEERIWTS